MGIKGASGVLIYGPKTRQELRPGAVNRDLPSSYETIPIPEMKILTPMDSANEFSQILQQALRDIKSGDYERPTRNESSSAPKTLAPETSAPDVEKPAADNPPDYETAVKN